MTRLFWVTYLIVAAFVFNGCGGHIESYSLVNPADSTGKVYETNDVRITISIVDERYYVLKLANKTDAPLRIFWDNSIAVNAQGSEVGIDAVLVEKEGIRDCPGATRVNPGESVYAQAYPVENVFKDSNGNKAHYPLYAVGDGGGSASDIEDSPIGIKLVLGINNRTRLIPLMLKVETSTY